jgi:putative flippase GtrA
MLAKGMAVDRALLGQLLRYGITGGLASVLNIALYWIGATFLGIDPNLAMVLGYLAAVVVGYVIHSRWSFRGHGRRGNVARTGGRFFLVSLVSLALNSLWVWLFVRYWGGPTWWPIPFTLTVTPLLVFWLNRRWVFE